MDHANAWKATCAQARAALKAGERAEARRLARLAARMAPDQEDPWLILAATAAPAASLGYLKQALAINPGSARAQKGIRWAEKRLAESGRATKQVVAEHNAAIALAPQWTSFALMAVALMTIAFALFVWFRPAGADEGLRAVSKAAQQQYNAIFATETPTPTATFTPTNTPTATPTFTPTNTPTSTPTPTDTPTPTATFTPTNTSPPPPTAVPPFELVVPDGIGDSERWIDVDLSTQTLRAYEGDDLIDLFTISSGRAGTPTVVGTFEVWVKVRIQDMSGPGYYIQDVPWVMYFHGDYGIHGTWWHNNFGTPMSAGCVNMTIADAQWLYGWASVGTVVNVHY